MVGFALCIGRLHPAWIVVCTTIALLFNLIFLKKISRGRLEIPEDKALGYSPGMLWYPGSLLLLSVVFYTDQVYMAIGWGAMAFGDAAASLAGRRVKGPALPWNGSKTWVGLLAFWLFGIPLTFGLLALLPASPGGQVASPFFEVAVAAAIAMSGVVETLPVKINDNVGVPFVAAGGAWLMSFIFTFF